MAVGFFAGFKRHVFAGSHELYHRKGQVREAFRVGFFLPGEEFRERLRIRYRRQGLAMGRGRHHDALPVFWYAYDSLYHRYAGVHQ